MLKQDSQDDFSEIIDALGADVQRFAGKTILISGGAGVIAHPVAG